MTLQDWNFFYGKIEISDFQQTPFKYVFSIAINVLLWDCMGKGACMKRMGAVRNCSTNTIMEKKRERGGRGLRIWNFQGYQRNSKWIFQRLIKNNMEYSGHDQWRIMWNFQESWFWVLTFLKGVTQLCGVSRGEALFCLQFPVVK